MGGAKCSAFFVHFGEGFVYRIDRLFDVAVVVCNLSYISVFSFYL